MKLCRESRFGAGISVLPGAALQQAPSWGRFCSPLPSSWRSSTCLSSLLSSTPAYTPPLTDNKVVFYRALKCSPCFEQECPLGHYRCLRDLPFGGSIYSHAHLMSSL
jgi:hypothetical protein